MYRDHRDLHVLTHSFPTRRSSELEALLDRSIGQVVSAANAGALDQRIDTAALDGVAAKIGQQINTLLDTMGEAINSIQTTVAGQIGRAHVCTPVTNAHLVCRLLLEQNNNKMLITYTNKEHN